MSTTTSFQRLVSSTHSLKSKALWDILPHAVRSYVKKFYGGTMMLNAQELRREVNRLLSEIREEHENIKEIFTSLGDDPSKYHFIVKNLENMYGLRRQLQELVGDAAAAMIAKELEACPDHQHSASSGLSRGDV